MLHKDEDAFQQLTEPPDPQDFNTVLAAIRSHPGHMKVRMDFQRCDVA